MIFRVHLQVTELRPKFGHASAVCHVLPEEYLRDPGGDLVLAFFKLLQQRVLDLELTEVGEQVCNAEGAVLALPHTFHAQQGIFCSNHGCSP